MKKETVSKQVIYIPALAMRDLVIFPKMIMHFDVARVRSVNSLKTAINGDRQIFLVTQNDVFVENPDMGDVAKIGVVAEIKQIIKTPDNITRVLVEGLYKARLIKLDQINDSELYAEVKKAPLPRKVGADNADAAALMRALKSVFERYVSVMPRMPKELFASVMGERDPEKLFESIAFNVSLMTIDKQLLLESNGVLERLSLLLNILSKEVEVLSIEKQIQEQVSEQIDRNQREYYLREQMKIIQSQLGENDDIQDEVFDYLEKIHMLNVSDEFNEKLFNEANRLLKMPQTSQEAAVIRGYLDTVLSLPWKKLSKDKTDIKKAQAVLDRDHYGLKKVKERILETLSVRALAPEVKGQIICLVGPPGVGKTSVGRSVAKALGRQYVRVSLGGVKDESDIRGHRKTYIGSMPGRIITALKQAGTRNPLILLDEIDKMSNDFRGDPASAMLEVLDSEQNCAFRDHYIELPFDLSDVLFVTTANTTDTIAPPLLDRMDVIELSSYTREEKFNIAKKHLIPKQLKKNGLKASNMKITDDGIHFLIDGFTREAGVRTLERTIASLCRKAAKEIVEDGVKKLVFKADNIEKYLGNRKYNPDLFLDKDSVGVVNGLAWTSVGGVIMPLEVLILDGKGNIELTGSLGDVMKESAKIAVSYCRSVYEKYNIQKDFHTNKDIHIHAPEGAVPKDGPSAGVALVTSLVSALSSIPVRSDVAMTGEITLHGKVLPIGGLREKTMAAYKSGIKTVIIPKANRPDLDEVDDIVKASINFVYAETLEQVLDEALVKPSVNPHEEFQSGLIVKNQKEHTMRS
ncbi:MAG: endopeptidase La [Oscillospiraceae bacterium]|jgi:ATP-dependent Lon protease